ncbi:MAG: VWA domain-containing protein, partial [Bacteroidetes bacterium]|nr:VWA domain-containing protein [Bacteroidota bacterium]
MNDRNNDVSSGTIARMRWSVLAGVLVFALLFVLQAAAPLHAQPNLNFKRVTANWPEIQLYFSVGCNGNPAYNMTKQDFRIFENGVEVPDFTLDCPDPNLRCPISVSLVFDASGSMSGSSNAGAKLGGHAFVDLMDGVIDEAAIIWFTSVVTVYQQMTTIKPMLHSAVDALPASGATAVWDGIYAGLIELINNGVNQCRGVVVLTDGGDNSSTRTVSEIISLANRHMIRVYTIGLGGAINATELEQIALLTGGRYYQTPNAGQLGLIYTEIFTLLTTQQAGECRITYERDCADGAFRTVELQLQNFCNGTDVKTKTYRAPLDSTTFTDLRMQIGSVNVMRGAEAVVPLELLTPMNGGQLYPMAFTLRFDETCMQFRSAQAPPGSLLAGVPLTVGPVPGGIRIETNDRKIIQGNGTLMSFTFQMPASGNITCCPIRATEVMIEQGCARPVIDSALVCVFPPEEQAWSCSIAVDSVRLDTARQVYDPMPFTVAVTVTNLGAVDIVDALRARISFPVGLSFAAPDSPLTAEKDVLPSPIAPGDSRTLTWLLQQPKQPLDRDYGVIVSVYSANDTSSCQANVHIPAFILPPLRYQLTASGSLQICEGDAVTLDGGDYARWSWSTGDTTRLLVVRDPGSYFCVALDGNGRVMLSDTVQVITYPAPQPPVLVDGEIPMCLGDSVRLEINRGYLSYRWNTGDTTRSIIVTVADRYYCEVVSMQGCPGVSDTVSVSYKPAPAKPVITRNGDVLMSSSEAFYYWFRDGQPIVGATAQFHVAVVTGSYRVRVTNANG